MFIFLPNCGTLRKKHFQFSVKCFICNVDKILLQPTIEIMEPIVLWLILIIADTGWIQEYNGSTTITESSSIGELQNSGVATI